MTLSRQLAVGVVILWVTGAGLLASTRTWTGNSVNVMGVPHDNVWTNPFNWSANVAPSAGDDLVFNGGIQASSINTFPTDTSFNSIQATGHVMQSGAIKLTLGISGNGAQISLGQITLAANQTFTAATSGNGLVVTSSIVTDGKTLTLDGPGNWTLVGPISGSGGLTIRNDGTTQLTAPNTYTGITRVDRGTLLVFGSQPASEVRVSTLTPPGGIGALGGAGTVGPVSFVFGGSIAPGGLNNGTGILSINGDLIFSFTQNCSLLVDIKGNAPGTGYDQVKTTGDVSMGQITVLTLTLDPAFTPARGSTFTIIKNDGPNPIERTFSGRNEGAVVTVGSATFVLSYRGGDGNDVVLRVPAIWDGGGTDNLWTTAANWVGDVAPVAGDTLLFPNGAAQDNSNNDFPAGTLFTGLVCSGQHIIRGNRILLGPGGAIGGNSASFGILTDVTLAGPSIFAGGSAGGSVIAGTLDLGPHTLTALAQGNAGLFLTGPVVGTGEIHKFGGQVGRLDFDGPAKAFTGAVRVFSGDIFVESALVAPVFGDAGGTAGPNDIDLNGTGSIGPLSVGGANVSPGFGTEGGVWTVNGSATFTGNTNLPGTLVIQLAGATRNNHDKLRVNGSVNLPKAALLVVLNNGFAPAVGATFPIVENDGSDPVVGTFQSKPEGSTFVVGGTTFGITYHGGDGNDIVLSVVAAAPHPAPSPKLGNISTRLRVETGENVLIGGMIVTGSIGKKVIIRALGPTLTDFGLPGALPDPTLELFLGNTLIASNDDWRSSAQAADIENSGFAPGKDAEAAIVAFLDVDTNFTAIVRGKNGQTGIGGSDSALP